ncbi:MAG TPA: hypothetical protein PKC19_23175, partial [Roseiflexaceae bacterium]|nr:hypothetical protein [Roseiflexaceae bacterium]
MAQPHHDQLTSPPHWYARLIRWSFTRFYNEFAWTYDAVAALVSAGQWHAWARSPAALASGTPLELGC